MRRDRSLGWARWSWVGLGITATWGGVTAAVALEAGRDWRMMAGLVGWIVCLAGVVLGLAIATVFASVGVCSRGRYRWLSAATLVVCLLAWAAPLLHRAVIDRWQPARVNPPAPAHGDMLGDVEVRPPGPA